MKRISYFISLILLLHVLEDKEHMPTLAFAQEASDSASEEAVAIEANTPPSEASSSNTADSQNPAQTQNDTQTPSEETPATEANTPPSEASSSNAADSQNPAQTQNDTQTPSEETTTPAPSMQAPPPSVIRQKPRPVPIQPPVFPETLDQTLSQVAEWNQILQKEISLMLCNQELGNFWTPSSLLDQIESFLPGRLDDAEMFMQRLYYQYKEYYEQYHHICGLSNARVLVSHPWLNLSVIGYPSILEVLDILARNKKIIEKLSDTIGVFHHCPSTPEALFSKLREFQKPMHALENALQSEYMSEEDAPDVIQKALSSYRAALQRYEKVCL